MTRGQVWIPKPGSDTKRPLGIPAIRDRIADERVITILARMLKSGVIQEGRWTPTQQGAPQGGPLSPLLSNIVLHQLDQELEARGHRFVRYADDFQIFKTTWPVVRCLLAYAEQL